jgi:hypothetical protein
VNPAYGPSDPHLFQDRRSIVHRWSWWAQSLWVMDRHCDAAEIRESSTSRAAVAQSLLNDSRRAPDADSRRQAFGRCGVPGSANGITPPAQAPPRSTAEEVFWTYAQNLGTERCQEIVSGRRPQIVCLVVTTT